MRSSSVAHRLPARSTFARESRRAACVVLAAALASGLVACSKREEPRGSPPPPPPSAKPATCAGGGGKIGDTVSAPFFPQASGGFCLDPNGGEKTFGEAAGQPIDRICDLFDGECEIYLGYGVRRVVEARYVDGSGSPATIDVYLSKFGTSEGAYAMFTRRIVGDGDPADEATARPTEGGGAAALGLGVAYLWRGAYLAELTYTNETAAEAAMKAAGEKLLPPLVKEMGSKLPGETALPPAVAALPKDDRIPLGVRFVTKDLLGIDGIGAGAFGYHKASDKRYRSAALVRADGEQTKDVMSTLAKLPGASKEKGIGEGAVRFMQKDAGGAPVEWVFARAGKNVLGIGDEARVLRTGMTADEHARMTLTRDEKIERLKKALAGQG
jgi:hypothetical protein